MPLIKTAWRINPPPTVGIDRNNPITRDLAAVITAGRRIDPQSGRHFSVYRSGSYGIEVPTSYGMASRQNNGTYTRSGFAGSAAQHTLITFVTLLTSTIYTYIAMQGGAGEYGRGSRLRYDKASLSFIWETRGDAGTSAIAFVESESTLGKTFVLAGTHDGAVGELWRNGDLVASGDMPSYLQSATKNIGIGADPGNYGVAQQNHLTLFFTRVLTESEIKSLSTNPFQVFAPQVLHLPLVVPVSGGVLEQYRALILNNGYLAQITDGLIGTGLKPLVLLDGRIKERETTEGEPLVMVNGVLCTMPPGGGLLA